MADKGKPQLTSVEYLAYLGPLVIRATTVTLRSTSEGSGEPERVIYGECEGIQSHIEIGYKNSAGKPYTGTVQYRIERGEPDQSVLQMIDGKLHVIVCVTPLHFSTIMNEFMGRPKSRMTMTFELPGQSDASPLDMKPHRMTKHARDPIKITSFEFVTKFG